MYFPNATLLSFVRRRRFRHIDVEFPRRVRVLKLYRSVMYFEFMGQHFANLVGNLLAFRGGHVQNVNVAGEGLGIGPQAPDVHVMNFFDPFHAEHGGRHALQAHAFGQAFHQDVDGVGDDSHRRPQDQSRQSRIPGRDQ